MADQMTAEQVAILEKVKKLLSLANNNDNEHQAEAASAKAMELLAAYNLDMAAIGNTAKGAQRKDNKMKGGLYAWQRDLWQAVCELNFCMYWSIKGLTKGSTYEHRILGSEVNVISAQIMAEYLQQTVERLARTYAADRYPGRSIFIKEMIAYREGMAHGLYHRLRKLRQDRIVEEERKRREQQAASRHPGSTGGTHLVLADVIQTEADLNNDFLHGYEPGTHARRRAENDARRAAAVAAADQALKNRDAAELADPSLKEERLAEEARRQKESDDWWAKYQKKQERRAQSEPRYRKPTAREERQQMGTFWKGVEKADEVSLNQQMDEDKKHRLT